MTQKKTIAILLSALFSACSGGAPERPEFRPGKIARDTSPIDVPAFASDAQIRQRILHMPFGEAGDRLGNLAFNAKSTFEFSRGNESYEQTDTFDLRVDPDGNFAVHLVSPINEVQLHLIGENVYVRQDKGETRRKPRREVEVDAWGDLAYGSVRDALGPFMPYLQIAPGTSERMADRDALKFEVSLSSERVELPADLPTPASTLPTAPPARWRELAKPLDLRGDLWIDAKDGVILQAKLKGRVEIADRDVRPTQLTMDFVARISEIGSVKKLEAPESVPEFRRTPPPRDRLSFFREHMPADPKAKTKK